MKAAGHARALSLSFSAATAESESAGCSDDSPPPRRHGNPSQRCGGGSTCKLSIQARLVPHLKVQKQSQEREKGPGFPTDIRFTVVDTSLCVCGYCFQNRWGGIKAFVTKTPGMGKIISWIDKI